MVHLSLIALHAVSGLVALAAGISVLRPPVRDVPHLFRLYLGALWAMVLFLALAVAIDWPALDPISRVTFAALTAFALFIGWRGWSARQRVRHRAPGWEPRYLDEVGFTLIALFDGFVIITALDLGAPVWLVVLIGLTGVLGGRIAIGRARARWLPGASSGRFASARARKERTWI